MKKFNYRELNLPAAALLTMEGRELWSELFMELLCNEERVAELWQRLTGLEMLEKDCYEELFLSCFDVIAKPMTMLELVIPDAALHAAMADYEKKYEEWDELDEDAHDDEDEDYDAVLTQADLALEEAKEHLEQVFKLCDRLVISEDDLPAWLVTDLMESAALSATPDSSEVARDVYEVMMKGMPISSGELLQAGVGAFGLTTITKTGVELIAEERERQISTEGWTPEHDDQHQMNEMIAAADCYMTTAAITDQGGCGPGDCQDHWPWDTEWWKPSEDPIRNLVKAGALIAAEIDRIARANASQGLR